MPLRTLRSFARSASAGIAAMTTLERDSVTPQRSRRKAVERPAAKTPEPGEILLRPGEEHILVGDRKRRPVDQADAGDQAERGLRRDVERLGGIVGRRHQRDLDVAVAGNAAHRADEVGEGAHGVEPAPDQPVLVGDEGAHPVLDVEEALAAENADRLAERRPADLELLGERHFADQAGARLELTRADLLAERIGDAFDEDLAGRPRAPDLLRQIGNQLTFQATAPPVLRFDDGCTRSSSSQGCQTTDL